MRVPFLPREATAILIMRRKFSYSINALANAFSRSPSLIHRILKFNRIIRALSFSDMRRFKDFAKKIGAARQARQLSFFMQLWTPFILGLAEKPP